VHDRLREHRAGQREHAGARRFRIEPELVPDIGGAERAQVIVAGLASWGVSVEVVFDLPDYVLGPVRCAGVVVLVGDLQAGLVTQVGVLRAGAGDVGQQTVQVADPGCVAAASMDEALDVERDHRGVQR